MDRSLILVEDLHRTIEHMYGGTATVTFCTNENNANIWEIRGYKKDLVVMLHYQNHCTETDEIGGSGDTIFIKEEPTDVGNMNHLNESNLDINCADDAVVYENTMSDADDSSCQSTILYASESSRCNSTSSEEAIPELDVVCAITNNVSGEYSQSFKSESQDEIKPNYDQSCHSNCESIVIHDVLPIIEEDAVESKKLQLSQNTGMFEQGPAGKLQTKPVCDSNDTNTSPMEDKSIVGNVEMMKLKNCFVSLEPLAITNLKINYLPATLEPDTFSMTNQVVSDGRNGFSVECCKCRKNFCTKPNLELHVKTVDDINLCPSCENSADCQSDIVNVQSQDHALYHCSECSISFCDLDSYNLHKHNKHLEYSECEELQRNDFESIEKPSHSSSHNEKLKKPMEKQTLIPSGEKGFECLHCGKIFSKNCNLRYHTLTHAGLKPFQCSSCGKKFSLKDSLTRHERIHSGGKLYKCSQCDRKFNRKDNLKIHELIHTGVKPYECLQCDKKFYRKDSLENHELTHTGVKPYECSQCGKKFNDKSNLNKHKRIHSAV